MEPIVNKVFNTFYSSKSKVSLLEKMLAIGIVVIPFIAALVCMIN